MKSARSVVLIAGALAAFSPLALLAAPALDPCPVKLSALQGIAVGDILVIENVGPTVVNEVGPVSSDPDRPSGSFVVMSDFFGSPYGKGAAGYSKGRNPGALPPDCVNFGVSGTPGPNLRHRAMELLKRGTPAHTAAYAKNNFGRFVPEAFENLARVRKGDLIVIGDWRGHVWFATADYAPGSPGMIELARRKFTRKPPKTSDRLMMDAAAKRASMPVWRIIHPGSPAYADAMWKFENDKQFNYGSTDPAYR